MKKVIIICFLGMVFTNSVMSQSELKTKKKSSAVVNSEKKVTTNTQQKLKANTNEHAIVDSTRKIQTDANGVQSLKIVE